MMQIRTYKTKEEVSLKDLMIKEIGPSKDGCIYLGEIMRGIFRQDCYHYFSTTVFVDSDSMSIVGGSNDISESHKRLESLLNIGLVPWKTRDS